MKMKATMIYGFNDIRLETVDRPEPGPGDVLIKVKVATTCGTDVKSIIRGRPGDTFPRLLGHGEASGVVEEVGKEVTSFHVGQRVVAHNSAPCFTCRMCLKGLYSLCEDFFYVKGAYQEYQLIPSRIVKVNMFEIPDNITFEEAAQLEPFSCAVYGAADSNIKLGDNVVIIGDGAQGLYFVILAKLYGAAKVIVSGHHDFRLDVAKKLGADELINEHKENAEEKVKELTGGYGADVVITAAGTPSAWEQAVRMVARGGIINQYGGCAPGTTFTVPTGRIHYDMITVKGTFHTTPYHVHKAWELIKSRKADLRPIVTHRIPLDDVKDAFDLLMTSKEALKIAIMP